MSAVAFAEPLSARDRALLRDRVSRARLRRELRAEREREEPTVPEVVAEEQEPPVLAAIPRAEPDRRRLAEEAPVLVPCACGCGDFLSPLDAKGRPRTFLSGHNGKLAKLSDEERRERKRAKDRRYRERHGERLREEDRTHEVVPFSRSLSNAS